MSKDIISKKTRYEFREYLVSWTLREIEIEFDSADISCDLDYNPPTSGARRSLVERYYHTLDFSTWADVRKLLMVYESILSHLEQQISREYLSHYPTAEEDFKRLRTFLRRDGFDYRDGRLVAANMPTQIQDIQSITSTLDTPELNRQIERMRSSVDNDPGLAIGTAKELIETVCKTILKQRGVPIEPGCKLPTLLKETRKVLKLLPEDIPDSAKGVETVRRLLNNLGSIGQNLGEIRNLYGTGHGRHAGAKGPTPRHAKLAVGASATLAMFLLETHEERD
jgi:hypothetical protein